MVLVKVKLQRISSKKQLLVQFIFIQPILSYFQRQPYRGVLKKGTLEICCKSMQEHPSWSVISIELLCNLTEIALRHECSSVNLLLIFQNTFFIKAHMDGCFYISNQPIIVFPSKHLLKENNLLCKLKPAEKFIFFQQSLLK